MSDLVIDADIMRAAGVQNVESPNDETAVLKDAHLLEAAAASDMRVLSKDTTAKRLFFKRLSIA